MKVIKKLSCLFLLATIIIITIKTNAKSMNSVDDCNNKNDRVTYEIYYNTKEESNIMMRNYINSYTNTIEKESVEISTYSDKEEVIEEDTPETIFDVFTKDERFILYRIVEAECTEGTIESKINVANVIFNRMESKSFPDTIKEIVFQYTLSNGKKTYQFSPIKDRRYYTVKVTEDTKEAVKRAYEEKDTTKGALYFDNCKSSSWASRNTKFLFTDDIGHSFYK